MDIEAIKKNNYDIKAVNPNRKSDANTRAVAQLQADIDERQKKSRRRWTLSAK